MNQLVMGFIVALQTLIKALRRQRAQVRILSGAPFFQSLTPYLPAKNVLWHTNGTITHGSKGPPRHNADKSLRA